MKRRTHCFAIILATCCAVLPARGNDPRIQLRNILDKDSITLLITDSGLGGLSVCGEIEQRAGQHRRFRKLRLVFCNALPEPNIGYNDMASRAQKSNVLSDALRGMNERVRPDAILIACNTLSVLYPETAFARTAEVPVIEIVGIAAEMFAQRLKADTAWIALLFGTETTISSHAHWKRMTSLGIDSARILTQACPKLETEIQADPESDLVKTYVQMYVDEAAGTLTRKDLPMVAGLCCTHYGYVKELFGDALRAAGIMKAEIVDPNTSMAQLIFPKGQMKEFRSADVTVQVFSRAVISEEEQRSIAHLLEPHAPKTAHALRSYHLDRNLFQFHPAH